MNTSTHISLNSLTELWVHTGTACNLNCPFCLEDSRPGDTRLERIQLTELKPWLDAAVQLDVMRFGFTGGEPLIIKDIVNILEYALSLRPCLVLTNGTAPLLKRMHQLQRLQQQAHPLSFRVSIDYPDEQRHDHARGWGNFRRALAGLQLLHTQGFAISIARQMDPNEHPATVEENFRALLRKARLPIDLPIVPLPELGRPFAAIPAEGQVMQNTSISPQHLACSYSRMLVKQNGSLRCYACPFTDDDTRFDLGDNLAQACTTRITRQHVRCHVCEQCGVSYSNAAALT